MTDCSTTTHPGAARLPRPSGTCLWSLPSIEAFLSGLPHYGTSLGNWEKKFQKLLHQNRTWGCGLADGRQEGLLALRLMVIMTINLADLRCYKISSRPPILPRLPCGATRHAWRVMRPPATRSWAAPACPSGHAGGDAPRHTLPLSLFRTPVSHRFRELSHEKRTCVWISRLFSPKAV